MTVVKVLAWTVVGAVALFAFPYAVFAYKEYGPKPKPDTRTPRERAQEHGA